MGNLTDSVIELQQLLPNMPVALEHAVLLPAILEAKSGDGDGDGKAEAVAVGGENAVQGEGGGDGKDDDDHGNEKSPSPDMALERGEEEGGLVDGNADAAGGSSDPVQMKIIKDEHARRLVELEEGRREKEGGETGLDTEKSRQQHRLRGS